MITKEFLNHILDFQSNFMGVVFDASVTSCNLRFFCSALSSPPIAVRCGRHKRKDHALHSRREEGDDPRFIAQQCVLSTRENCKVP